MRLEHWIIVAFVALCAGMTGVFLAGNWSPAPEVQRASGLHDLIHKDLELSDAQEQRLEVVERKFAARKKELEARLRAANLALADAIETDKANSPSSYRQSQYCRRAEQLKYTNRPFLACSRLGRLLW